MYLLQITINCLSLTHQNIEKLILLCQKKNHKAQCEVYTHNAKAIYTVTYRIAKDAHYTEDGFLKTFSKLHFQRFESKTYQILLLILILF